MRLLCAKPLYVKYLLLILVSLSIVRGQGEGEGAIEDAGEGATVNEGGGATGDEGRGATGNESEGVTGGEGEGATEDEGEGATVGEGEGATGDEGGGATGGEGEGATEDAGEGATVNEGGGATGDEGRGATGNESEGATGGEGEGATEDEGEGATVGEGEGATEDEGEGATGGAGEGATRGEGEGTTESEDATGDEGGGAIRDEGGGATGGEGEGATGESGYDRIKELQDSILSSAKYSTTLRPVRDQTQPIYIDVTFSLVAVVAIDNVKQELITNCFLLLSWSDERRSWDPNEYGGIETLTPSPIDIWRPRLLLINTMDKRDPFEDNYSHTQIRHDGHTIWVPGGLFYTYCALNIEKFPFDIQNCQIQMCPMSHEIASIEFVAASEVDLAFYYPNPGWELLKATITVQNFPVSSGVFSCPVFSFQLKRRPTTIVLNVIIPVILLSVLNNLVFLIPVDSGEKISYAITVLLSLTVFLSMVSTMTPQVSDAVPALTIYLFVLLLSSVLTVAAAIFSVYLHNLEETKECNLNDSDSLKNVVKRALNIKIAVAPLDAFPDGMRDGPASLQDTVVISPDRNPYRLFSKHINKVFSFTMNGITLIATVWYFIVTNA